jgi:predicted nucleic-acid-binding protein
MIGIDTNVLVRHFIHDDTEQAARADAFFRTLSATNQGYLSLVVMAESYWVMRVVFKIPKQTILDSFDRLLEVEEVAFQSPEIVSFALRACKGKGNAMDFADALIACSCQAGGCSKTVTFDKRAAGFLGVELL